MDEYLHSKGRGRGTEIYVQYRTNSRGKWGFGKIWKTTKMLGHMASLLAVKTARFLLLPPGLRQD